MVFALYILKESLSLGVGGLHQPGPGLAPMLEGFVILFFSAIIFTQSFLAKSSSKGNKSHEAKENPLPAVYTIAGLIVYAIILEYAGFILSTFALVVFLMKLFEKKRWWVNLVTGGLVSSAFYILFAVLLKAELPLGILALFF
jgi:putative tricarboxylic transport membrane protein